MIGCSGPTIWLILAGKRSAGLALAHAIMDKIGIPTEAWLPSPAAEHADSSPKERSAAAEASPPSPAEGQDEPAAERQGAAA